MSGKIVAAALAVLFSADAAFGQQACSSAQLASAIDTYGLAPYSARSWRMLNGLGDPGIEPQSSGYDWQASDEWKVLVTKLAPNLTPLAEPGYDCRLDYPLQILKDRVAMFGAGSAYVGTWLRGQQNVVAACSASDAVFDTIVPADLPPEQRQLLAQDSAYQVAAAAFYKDKQKALELFRAIATSDSPHRAAARYNIANLLAGARNIKDATAEANSILADPSLKPVHRIAEDLLGYIANIADTAEGWSAVINRSIATLSRPAADIAASPDLTKAYAAALFDIDFAGVAGKQDDWWLSGRLPSDPTISKALVDAARTQPMALWMMAGQSIQQAYNAVPWVFNGSKWNSWTANYVQDAFAHAPAGSGIAGPAKDMLEVLQATPDDTTRAMTWAKAKDAIAAAASSCGHDPRTAAAAQLLHHAVRLSALAGAFEEIYTGLQDVPFKQATSVHTGTIYALGQYLLGTGNLEEGRRYRERLLTPSFFLSLPPEQRQGVQTQFARLMAALAEDEQHWLLAVALADDRLGDPVINLLPASKLRALANQTVFSAAQREILSRAAWTRNYARGIAQKPERFRAILDGNAALAQTHASIAQEYPGIESQNRELLTILRNPRFGILASIPELYSEPLDGPAEQFADIDLYDHNDRNWWCPLQPDRHLGALRETFNQLTGAASAVDIPESAQQPWFDPAIIKQLDDNRAKTFASHPMVRQIDWKEVSALAKAPSAPQLLSKRAIGWARTAKDGSGADEALARAVTVTRYGCNWNGSVKSASKPAQELLKTRFPKSPWTAKTPYWFDCLYELYDAEFNKVATCKPKTWPRQPRP